MNSKKSNQLPELPCKSKRSSYSNYPSCNSAFAAFRQGVCDSFSSLKSSSAWKDFEECANSTASKKDGIPISVLAIRRSVKKRSSETVGSKTKPEKSLIARRLVQSVVLNLGCILLLHCVIFPTINWVACKLFWSVGPHSNAVTIFLSITWVMPLFFVTRVLNIFWFQDIAQAVMLRRRIGTTLFTQSYSSYLADLLMSTIVEFLFLLQTYLVGLLPIAVVSKILSVVHISLLYSLYAFEYLWMNQGVSLSRRLRVIQRQWPYFLGFGLSLSLLTACTSSIFVSSCVFGIFFPVLILSSFLAKPPSVRNWIPINFFAASLSWVRQCNSTKLRKEESCNFECCTWIKLQYFLSLQDLTIFRTVDSSGSILRHRHRISTFFVPAPTQASPVPPWTRQCPPACGESRFVRSGSP
uniref:Etoposide-induced protein 2.4 homolog n=1 Tax=Trichuris muris TaxID=70415 RepID=A0A5S6Q285_TRIMR